MKKILTLIAVLTLSLNTLPAEAKLKNSTTTPTLAILDTALDTSIPSIKQKLVGEVCILDWNSCANGKNFMEGPGASSIPMNIMSTPNFNHGTQMASIAIANNPNMNILFIRIIGHTASGQRQITKSTLVPKVLTWISQNKTKYNIQAVAMSQGHHNLLSGPNYCPVNMGLDIALNTLNTQDVPVFFAVGNNRDYSRVDWPACSSAPNVIGVGGVFSRFVNNSWEYGDAELFNNYDQAKLDFYDIGYSPVLLPGNLSGNAAGSSVANASMAAKWVAIKSAKSLSTSQVYDLVKRTAVQVTNSKNMNGFRINMEAALNG